MYAMHVTYAMRNIMYCDVTQGNVMQCNATQCDGIELCMDGWMDGWMCGCV